MILKGLISNISTLAGMVVLQGLICYNFHFGTTVGPCLLKDGVVVLEGLF